MIKDVPPPDLEALKNSSFEVDQLASALLPKQNSDDLIPLKTPGLGNCLYNAVSMCLSGKHADFSFVVVDLPSVLKLKGFQHFEMSLWQWILLVQTMVPCIFYNVIDYFCYNCIVCQIITCILNY